MRDHCSLWIAFILLFNTFYDIHISFHISLTQKKNNALDIYYEKISLEVTLIEFCVKKESKFFCKEEKRKIMYNISIMRK